MFSCTRDMSSACVTTRNVCVVDLRVQMFKSDGDDLNRCAQVTWHGKW